MPHWPQTDALFFVCAPCAPAGLHQNIHIELNICSDQTFRCAQRTRHWFPQRRFSVLLTGLAMQGCIDAITTRLSSDAKKYLVLPAHHAHFCNAAGCTFAAFYCWLWVLYFRRCWQVGKMNRRLLFKTGQGKRLSLFCLVRNMVFRLQKPWPRIPLGRPAGEGGQL